MENNTQTANNIPISIIVEESKKKIVDTINGLQLSPTILDFIIKDIYVEVQNAHKNEYQRDLKEQGDKLKINQIDANND